MEKYEIPLYACLIREAHLRKRQKNAVTVTVTVTYFAV
jgi:hypothetical protein